MKKYWTKCNREFRKSSTAEVTGYRLQLDTDGTVYETSQDIFKECEACTWKIDVKEGWGENQRHSYWECRAGSKPPNHVSEWTGSLEDKNSIHIHSLDNTLMESIREYAKGQPDVSAAYNADSQADCRRTLSVSCSGNKKGIAAKKALIDKFFPVEVLENDNSYHCEDCKHSLEDEDSDKLIKCPIKHTIKSKKQIACDKFEPWEDDFDYEELEGMDLEDQLDTLLEAEDKPVSKFDPTKCPAYSICESNQKIDYPGLCELYYACALYKKLKETEEKEVGNDRLCSQFGKSNCHIKKDAPQWCTKADEKICAYFKAEGMKKNARNLDDTQECDGGDSAGAGRSPGLDEEMQEIEKESTGVAAMGNDKPVVFDYSLVDAETGEYLQSKAKRITEIRIRSVMELGKELKDAQDRLANHYKGSFQKWVESLGITAKTAYYYIHGFD